MRRPIAKERMPADRNIPVGVFDSGVGGLSVLRAIRVRLPGVPLIYLGDQANVPYGPRSLQEVQGFSESITRFLLAQGAGMIVVACNTASAASLKYLRNKFAGIPFVGMEPAVKPAAEITRSGLVGVLATPATFQGALYASVVERFAQGVTILQDTCPGLVHQIETGELESLATRDILEKALLPMLARGIDTVVLGCTHYPFVIPLISKIVGPNVRVIDPAPAVARQVENLYASLLPEQRLESKTASVNYYTTGSSELMQSLLKQLLGDQGEVMELPWNHGEL